MAELHTLPMPGSRDTVVLLHSSASSARQWDALTDVLTPRFRVCAVELHGHGGRGAWTGVSPLRLADDAALIEPLLDAAPGGLHLIGHSYGAAVALKFATMHPQSVRSLVVYEPVLFRLLRDTDGSSERLHEIVGVADSIDRCVAHGDLHAAAQGFIDFWSGAGSWNSMLAPRQHAIAARMAAVSGHFGAVFAEQLDFDELTRHEVSSLVITGERTVPVTRRIGELLRSALPTAQHETLAGAGHMGPITHSRDFNRLVEKFLISRADASQLDTLSSAVRNFRAAGTMRP